MTRIEYDLHPGAGWRVRALAAGALGLLLLGTAGAPAQAQNAGAPEGSVSANAQTASIGPGKVIEVPASSTSFTPTTAQIVNLEQLLVEASGAFARDAHDVVASGDQRRLADQCHGPGPASTHHLHCIRE